MSSAKLSWFKPTKQWKKYIGHCACGKSMHYFGTGAGKTDQEGYKKALARYQEHLEKFPPPDPTTTQWEKITGETAPESRLLKLHGLNRYTAGFYTPPAAPGAKTVKDALKLFQDTKKARMHATAKAKVAGVVLNKKERMSPNRFSLIYRASNAFGEFVGFDRSIESIGAEDLQRYYLHLMEKVAAGGKDGYAARNLNIAKQFITESAELDLLALPKNLKRLSISDTPGEKNPFTNPEIKTLLERATDRTRLYIMLLLNTGMQNADIAALTWDMVDFKSGRITKAREKTNAIKVSWKLWPETLRLLKQEKSNDPNLVLVNDDGKPLQSEKLKDNGNYQKVDNISTAYFRLCRQQLKQRKIKALKYFRQTSATRLDTKNDYRHLIGVFMGHSPRDIAHSNYVDYSQGTLDKACLWLRESYELDKVEF